MYCCQTRNKARSKTRQASRRYDIVMDAKWVFVCDVDEYLNVHLGDGSAQALVAGSGEDADVISIPWHIFRPGRIEEFKDAPVTEEFTQGEYEWDATERPTTGKFVKSIHTNQHKFQRMGLHVPVSLEAHLEDTKRVLPGGADYIVNGARTENPPLFTHAQVNHYALRSVDNFLIKRARGRANHSHHALGLCCTNPMKDSRHESSMIAVRHEQLVPDKIQDDKLVVI